MARGWILILLLLLLLLGGGADISTVGPAAAPATPTRGDGEGEESMSMVGCGNYSSCLCIVSYLTIWNLFLLAGERERDSKRGDDVRQTSSPGSS